MTQQQELVLAVLREEGRMSSLHLSGSLRRRHPDRAWSVFTVRKVLRQLKYRGLVEYDACWFAVPTDTSVVGAGPRAVY